ncbi:MAG TPA: hypothetical protein VGM03_21125 [Phycisphaerae bacterium]
MNVYVDDQAYALAAESAGTIGDAVEQVRKGVSAGDRVLIGLRCDGLDVVGNELEDALRRPSAHVQRLDITTGAPLPLVIEALEQSLMVLEDSRKDLAEVVTHLSTGQTAKGMGLLAEAFRNWQQINEALGSSMAMLKIDPDGFPVGELSATQAILAPRELLTHIKDVVETHDHVLLADILQYEFDTVAATWKSLIEAVLARAHSEP